LRFNSFYKGIFYTILASLFWGIPQPLFFNKINFIPPLEILIHRGLWSFIFLFIIIFKLRKIKEFFNIFKSNKKILFLSITSILISINWGGFIYAVSLNRIQDASMGYFISPMISIVLGYCFLNEKMSPLKMISVLMMLGSIVFLSISLNAIPYLALLIALSWGLYGLLRKQINILPEIGLLYESGFISLIGGPYLVYLNFQDVGFFLNSSEIVTILLILTGAVTVFPLFFFNLGVRFIPLGLAGVIFYIAPSFHFITSVFILNETISLPKLISFIIIWIAIFIFIVDMLNEEKKVNENNTQLLS
jgi:chloramphenicol-sensitive protein RarD